ncbi:FAD-binding oxidoreductase [Pigmentiphaga aceris]|uniref:FAD-binding oxidoreductase n=1 Tax=Pigmentiphaga aceris TaxID=1940612 RepID=A0A5C0AT11_9BURK|nr:FAD-binding oxidoreductase [Pigmentiphaga aceris]QEI04746.1 FAD-binding oxidoreductase [Pigmentiphaga aceris]
MKQQQEVVAAMRGLVGDTDVVDTAADMQAYVADWWGRNAGVAACVVFPRSTEAVSKVLAWCNEHDVSVFPQGGNTSVCGGAIPDQQGCSIVLNLLRMNRIRDINPRDNAMTVDGGCVLGVIHEAALSVERIFPLSLGAEGSCQIGGNLSTNAGGTNVLRYGNTRDLVLGVEVVLPDGTIWNGLRTLRKNNSGYDMKHLFMGAEGTLGVITGASLKLFPKPRTVVTALLGLATVEAAVDEGLRLQGAFPGTLDGLEIISRSEMEIVLAHAHGTRDPLAQPANWYVLVELATPQANDDTLSEKLMTVLTPSLESGAIEDAIVASSEKQRQDIWKIRHAVTECNRHEGMGLSHDIAVPIHRIPDFIAQAEATVKREFPIARQVVVGHMGDGNLHYITMIPHDVWAGIEDKPAYARRVAHALYDIAASMGGTFSAEHGIGSAHVAEMSKYKDPVELAMMRQVKGLFDPKGIMNPGRVLPAA